ncbi:MULTISPECIES: MarR family winged helix-turn-helix transcriptional regulator [Corynebacterium]|uniref:DNA-binding MarR family transcriptional regulator n=1 Tax=Corynebacterium freneyi TaxID=134034 RepID=A0ABS4U8G6_9CORY|nr:MULTISPECIES: MarR family transcriptional regulator [Corynebacterium]MBP2332953.1 DNA-binding MarR family transcriptional regulator [Corynebacterium freneyi]MCG7438174.1 MarR family transcriptional regulator [Corynebacterium freneyi]OFU53103.1 transcriptional regulator [Corynebacterium sp. HMSC11E11]QXA52936.1 MarR family transcriptional regulator [Corynebacterium freneyi]UBI03110.1 MarR family transcriptional regulator [Corynebacterium freneyi]
MQQEVPWLDDDEQTLWRAMMDAAKAVERAMDTRLLATEEISSADFSVLVQLSEAEGGTVRMRELCEALRWDRSRMSHQITRMARRGLVNKLRCANDSRGIDVELTAHGRDVIERAAPDHVRMIRRIVFDELDAVPGLDRDAALAALRNVSTAAEAFRDMTLEQ